MKFEELITEYKRIEEERHQKHIKHLLKNKKTELERIIGSKYIKLLNIDLDKIAESLVVDNVKGVEIYTGQDFKIFYKEGFSTSNNGKYASPIVTWEIETYHDNGDVKKYDVNSAHLSDLFSLHFNK